MLTLALAAMLATSPNVHAIDLELEKLEAEQPGTGGFLAGGVMLGLGTASTLGGIGLAAANFCIWSCRDSGALGAGLVMTGAGLVVTVLGGIVMTALAIVRGGERGRRIARLREERELFATGTATRKQREEVAERHRPGRGPPVALLAIGTASFATGAVVAGTTRMDPIALIFAAGLPAVIGVCFGAAGVRELFDREAENAAIDAELEKTPAAPAVPMETLSSRLPPAPAFIGWAWSF